MEMEEMMMMMMISSRSSPANPRIQSISNDPITNCPTWKLYENPFYTNTPHNQKHKHQQHSRQLENKASSSNSTCSTDQLKQVHRIQLPVSARKIAASFWDLTFIRPLMESELDKARAKITELKAGLEQERKARKKAESMNKKLARELSEVKKSREALERLCEELAKQVSTGEAEMSRMHKDMEEERKMLRMAEVLREERVQMKLAEAKLLLEEKLTELEATKTKQMIDRSKVNDQEAQHRHIFSKADESFNKTWSSNGGIESADDINSISRDSSGEEIKSCVLVEKPAPTTTAIIAVDGSSGSNASAVIVAASQRRASPEPENPHIKRGIKGFVEFPKVVRAIGSKSRHFGTKLECQKAQLRILLKQKTPIRSSNHPIPLLPAS
ncbi:protein BRANCHLESS TRICHOME-like [Coffea arabica]|uniref:Protein BRANCHLESS TRICHOME-like n=1 Tax=Coffea arabica TaxID=13443 RepID=A0A6P6TQP6_COFAR|nr:protein BRANCHLESS TRICHOME-like [Coffea arabica]